MCTVAIRFTTEGDQSLLPTPSSIPLHFSFYSLCQPEYTSTRTYRINIYNIHIYTYTYTHTHTQAHNQNNISAHTLLSLIVYIYTFYRSTHVVVTVDNTTYTADKGPPPPRAYVAGCCSVFPRYRFIRIPFFNKKLNKAVKYIFLQ